MGHQQAVGPVGPAVTRRGFGKLVLGWLIASSAAMVVAPLIGFLIPPRRSAGSASGRLLAGTTSEIVPGRSKVVAFGSKPVIVLNTEQGVKAFSAVCTHLGCIVGYDASLSADIVSPCHDGHFSAFNGTVISGPPPAPLQEYPVSLEEDQIFVQDA